MVIPLAFDLRRQDQLAQGDAAGGGAQDDGGVAGQNWRAEREGHRLRGGVARRVGSGDGKVVSAVGAGVRFGAGRLVGFEGDHARATDVKEAAVVAGDAPGDGAGLCDHRGINSVSREYRGLGERGCGCAGEGRRCGVQHIGHGGDRVGVAGCVAHFELEAVAAGQRGAGPGDGGAHNHAADVGVGGAAVGGAVQDVVGGQPCAQGGGDGLRSSLGVQVTGGAGVCAEGGGADDLRGGCGFHAHRFGGAGAGVARQVGVADGEAAVALGGIGRGLELQGLRNRLGLGGGECEGICLADGQFFAGVVAPAHRNAADGFGAGLGGGVEVDGVGVGTDEQPFVVAGVGGTGHGDFDAGDVRVAAGLDVGKDGFARSGVAGVVELAFGGLGACVAGEVDGQGGGFVEHRAGQGQVVADVVVAAAVGDFRQGDHAVTRHAARNSVFVGQAFDQGLGLRGAQAGMAQGDGGGAASDGDAVAHAVGGGGTGGGVGQAELGAVNGEFFVGGAVQVGDGELQSGDGLARVHRAGAGGAEQGLRACGVGVVEVGRGDGEGGGVVGAGDVHRQGVGAGQAAVAGGDGEAFARCGTARHRIDGGGIGDEHVTAVAALDVQSAVGAELAHGVGHAVEDRASCCAAGDAVAQGGAGVNVGGAQGAGSVGEGVDPCRVGQGNGGGGHQDGGVVAASNRDGHDLRCALGGGHREGVTQGGGCRQGLHRGVGVVQGVGPNPCCAHGVTAVATGAGGAGCGGGE